MSGVVRKDVESSVIEESNREFAEAVSMLAGGMFLKAASATGVPAEALGEPTRPCVEPRFASPSDQLSIADLQEIYGCSYSKAYRIMSQLPCSFKVGQKLYVFRKDLEKHVKRDGMHVAWGSLPPSQTQL